MAQRQASPVPRLPTPARGPTGTPPKRSHPPPPTNDAHLAPTDAASLRALVDPMVAAGGGLGLNAPGISSTTTTTTTTTVSVTAAARRRTACCRRAVALRFRGYRCPTAEGNWTGLFGGMPVAAAGWRPS
ncbi:hypothetical protein [Streptacidiphilus sp. EB129]|uniref:hypothetical protein n=1 Tax=Streptacidiphilus sp. EB129 TaxID=3156262 RepID=UPI003519796D